MYIKLTQVFASTKVWAFLGSRHIFKFDKFLKNN